MTIPRRSFVVWLVALLSVPSTGVAVAHHRPSRRAAVPGVSTLTVRGA